MSVYVDDARMQLNQRAMCHMTADSRAELDAMADRIGVARWWIEDAGTGAECYVISRARRRMAVAFGAVETFYRDIAHPAPSPAREGTG